MKRNISLILLLLVVICSFAQVPITIPTNALRHGDVLCKIQAPYVSAGESGENNVWQLGRVNDDCPDFMQSIRSNGDTIAVYETERIQHYLVRNDTLFDKGEQSRRAYNIYNEERPLLHYPFAYGDSISGDYHGNGRYEWHTHSTDGFGYTVADGLGCLTDGEDTLHYVTRIHMHDDYRRTSNNGLIEHFTSERYLWYCTGYRYPVMETVLTKLHERNTTFLIDSVAYLYLPVMQLSQLEADEENAILLAEQMAADAEQALYNAVDGNNSDLGSLSSIEASLSSDGQTLNLHYMLDSDSNLSFVASDIVGCLLGSAHYNNRAAGEWQENITLLHRPIGGILLLSIQCEEQTMQMKVKQ